MDGGSGGSRMLSEDCYVACDDGRVVKLGGGYTVVACILWCGRPVDVELHMLKVDSLEASSTITYSLLTLALRNKVDVKALLLDSITIAGFNIVSPATIAKLAGTPVIVVYKYKPSSKRLEEALRKHFNDWMLRMKVLRIVDEALEVHTRKGVLYMITWGITFEDAVEIVEKTQLYARIPEPLRIADMVASETTSYLFQVNGLNL